MAQETTSETKMVEVKLDRPYTTNGNIHGYEEDGEPIVMRVGENREKGKKQIFTGRALVTKELAADLNRRQDEFRAYERSLHLNQGREMPVEL